jgi:hypothetical protein
MGIGLLVTATLFAQLHAAAPSGPNPQDNPAALAGAVVETVGMAVDARQTASQDVGQEDVAATALRQMINIRIAMNKLATASALMKPFTASGNEDLAKVARGFAQTYERLEAAYEESLGVHKRLIAVETSEELGELLSDASKSGALFDQLWKLLPLNVAALSHLLVDSSKERDGHICCLVITSSERKELRDAIRDGFPDAIKNGGKGGFAGEVAIYLLWDFLEQPWKAKDES